MRAPGLFHLDRRPAVAPGRVRLTRLNIYSGLYVEWARAAVLVDPAKVPAHAVVALDPDLILVSHESMDHFDAGLCADLLRDRRRRLVGSWGVVLALADCLSPADPRWQQVVPGLPDCRYRFGDLDVGVHGAIHCEYAVPLFFDVRDRASGFRLLDAIDTAITPAMRDGSIPPGPDVLIAPAGIALGVTPGTAWQMAELLQPVVVVASHFTHERDEFLRSRVKAWPPDRVHAPVWHEALAERGGDPQYDPGETPIGVEPSPALRGLVTWMSGPREMPGLLELARAPEPVSQTHALHALAHELSRARTAGEVSTALSVIGERVLATGDEPLIAAWLLAWGVCLAGQGSEATAEDLGRVRHLLSPDRPYLGYWVLECWGRSAANPRLAGQARTRLAEVAADEALWNTVGLRRKLMWEVERLVRAGVAWPDIPSLLARALGDENPDVRLLAYRILPLVDSAPGDRRPLLQAGLSDGHEDVLEEAVAAHITLFDHLTDGELEAARTHLSDLQRSQTYHVRERANALAELLASRAGRAVAVPDNEEPLQAGVAR